MSRCIDTLQNLIRCLCSPSAVRTRRVTQEPGPERIHRHRYFGVLAPNAPCALRSPPRGVSGDCSGRDRLQLRRARHRPGPWPRRPLPPGTAAGPDLRVPPSALPPALTARCAPSPSSPTLPPCATSPPPRQADHINPDRARSGSPTLSSGWCRARSDPRSSDPAYPGPRVRPAPHLVTKTAEPASLPATGRTRTCGRNALPSWMPAHAISRTPGKKLPHGDTQPLLLPVGAVASTRDTLTRKALRGVGFPILNSRAAAPRRTVARAGHSLSPHRRSAP
jgi:hypothetical protein